MFGSRESEKKKRERRERREKIKAKPKNKTLFTKAVNENLQNYSPSQNSIKTSLFVTKHEGLI